MSSNNVTPSIDQRSTEDLQQTATTIEIFNRELSLNLNLDSNSKVFIKEQIEAALNHLDLVPEMKEKLQDGSLDLSFNSEHVEDRLTEDETPRNTVKSDSLRIDCRFSCGVTEIGYCDRAHKRNFMVKSDRAEIEKRLVRGSFLVAPERFIMLWEAKPIEGGSRLLNTVHIFIACRNKEGVVVAHRMPHFGHENGRLRIRLSSEPWFNASAFFFQRLKKQQNRPLIDYCELVLSDRVFSQLQCDFWAYKPDFVVTESATKRSRCQSV